MMDKVEISTAQLKKGMYVSRLDRPWTETPFLFQGFTIQDDDDIEQLQEYCKTVVVDVPRSDVDEETIRKAQQANGKVNGTAKKALGDVPEPDFSRTGQYYVNTEALGAELARAQEIEKEASKAISNVIEGVRNGEQLDVPQLEEVVDPLVDSVLRNSDAMSWLMRIRETDEYVYQHSIGTSVWAVVFGRHLGFDKETLNAIGLGGMLLDIGKTRLPNDLLKKSSRLDKQETLIMVKHVEIGLEILKESGNHDPRVEIMVATHHERFDGSGYPNRLKGTNIPVLGRLAGIVDSYDAMVSKRPYAKPRSTFAAMRELQNMAGKRFQKEMIDQFVQAVGMFPTGSLVELNTGEVAVVTKQNNYQRLRPEVMVVLDREKNLCEDFRTIDLRMSQDEDMSRESMWIDRGLEPGSYGIDPSEYFL